MVLLLVALSASAANPPPVTVRQGARASITILRPYRASPETWNPLVHANQREVLRAQGDGGVVRLRLTEFE